MAQSEPRLSRHQSTEAPRWLRGGVNDLAQLTGASGTSGGRDRVAPSGAMPGFFVAPRRRPELDDQIASAEVERPVGILDE